MIKTQITWRDLLADEFKKPYFVSLSSFLKSEREGQTIYPAEQEVFSALKTLPYHKVKVVIIGQDPYHQPNQAHGLAFSVKDGQACPPSLKNIFKEIERQTQTPCFPSGNLQRWAEQGVLLLNTVLTVRRGQPNSHKGKGWELWTNKVISVLNSKPEPLVFILWGNNAKSFKQFLTNPKHLVLESPHPSPFSAHSGFFGNQHFLKTNEFLQANKLTPIDWR